MRDTRAAGLVSAWTVDPVAPGAAAVNRTVDKTYAYNLVTGKDLLTKRKSINTSDCKPTVFSLEGSLHHPAKGGAKWTVDVNRSDGLSSDKKVDKAKHT